MTITRSSFIPDAFAETTTMDAGAQNLNFSGEAWASLHDEANGSGVSSNATTQTAVTEADSNVNVWQTINRIILTFDIGAIPAADAILAATLRLSVRLDARDFAVASDLVLCESSPVSDFDIEVADYNYLGFGTVRLAPDLVGLETSRHFAAFQLNAAGLDFLAAAKGGDGIVRLGLLTPMDFDDVEPTWVGSDIHNVNIETADQSAAVAPRLFIDHGSRVSFDAVPAQMSGGQPATPRVTMVGT